MTPDPLTPSPDSPTPRTDEFIRDMCTGNARKDYYDLEAFVRNLERENAALVKEREALMQWYNLGKLAVDIANGRAIPASATSLDDNPVNCISFLHTTLAEREAKESSLIKELHSQIEQRNATINRQADILAERDREIEYLKKRLTNTPARMQEMERETDSLRAQLAETQRIAGQWEVQALQWKEGRDHLSAKLQETELELMAAASERDGIRGMVKTWQERSSQLAAQFPGVEWTDVNDFIPHVQALRDQLADLEARGKQNVIDWQKEFTKRDDLYRRLADMQLNRDTWRQAADDNKRAYEETQEKLKEAETDAREANRRWEGVVELNITFTNQLLALQAHVERLTSALLLCKDALEYGGIGDDRPHNRLIALIESERSKFSGDNWDYWNYLSEKLQACGQPLANALSSQPDLTFPSRRWRDDTVHQHQTPNESSGGQYGLT